MNFRMLSGIAIVALAGCAAAPPTEQIAASEAAVGAALEAGAGAAAPAEIARAREKLRLMRRSLDAGDYQPARWLAEQAQVDAELASARALRALRRQ